MAGDAVYGLPPAELAATPAGAVQTSPLIPGSSDLGALRDQFELRRLIGRYKAVE